MQAEVPRKYTAITYEYKSNTTHFLRGVNEMVNKCCRCFQVLIILFCASVLCLRIPPKTNVLAGMQCFCCGVRLTDIFIQFLNNVRNFALIPKSFLSVQLEYSVFDYSDSGLIF